MSKYFSVTLKKRRLYLAGDGKGGMRVMLPGDLMDITDMMTFKELQTLKRKFNEHKETLK
jgi:hypothetical protein